MEAGTALGRLAVDHSWLPMQLRYRMLCAAVAICLDAAPLAVDAWASLAVSEDGHRLQGNAAERRPAAAWAMLALERMVQALLWLETLVRCALGRGRLFAPPWPAGMQRLYALLAALLAAAPA